MNAIHHSLDRNERIPKRSPYQLNIASTKFKSSFDICSLLYIELQQSSINELDRSNNDNTTVIITQGNQHTSISSFKYIKG